MRLKLTYRVYLWATIIIWLAYGAFTLTSFFTVSNYDIFLGILICGPLIHLTLLAFIRNWFKLGRPKLLDWFKLATFFILILNFLRLITVLDTHTEILVDKTVYVKSAYAFDTMLMILVALLSMLLAEVMVSKIKLSKSIFIPKTYTLRNVNIFVIIVVFVTFVQSYLMLTGLIGYGTTSETRESSSGFLLQAIQIAGPLFLVLLSAFIFIYKSKSKLLIYLLVYYFIIQMLYGFLSGMKEEIITPIILLLVPYILSGKAISKIFIGSGVVFMILLYPINNSYRDVTNLAGNKLTKSQTFIVALNSTLNKDFLDLFSSGSEQYESRLSLFPINMYTVKVEKDWTTYKYLNRYIYLPVSWIIPRALLPSKPQSDTGEILYQMQTGSKGTSITPSTYGWAYLEGGMIPLSISFFIFGALLTYVERKLDLRRLFDLLLFCVILITMLKIESDIYFRLAGLFQTILITFLLYRLLIKETYKREAI